MVSGPQGPTGVQGPTGPANIYGSEFEYAEELSVSTNNTPIYQNKLNHNTAVLPAGTYKISWSYAWDKDDNFSDFQAQVEVDATIYVDHLHEPKEPSITNAVYTSGFFYVIFGAPATHTIDVNFASEIAGDVSYIWDVRIEVLRVQ